MSDSRLQFRVGLFVIAGIVVATVLALRFGLDGTPKLSLSQVGQVLEVSKERVRQIQNRALSKLRDAAAEHGLLDALPLGA